MLSLNLSAHRSVGLCVCVCVYVYLCTERSRLLDVSVEARKFVDIQVLNQTVSTPL